MHKFEAFAVVLIFVFIYGSNGAESFPLNKEQNGYGNATAELRSYYPPVTNGGLQLGFYGSSCPDVESIVKWSFLRSVIKDITTPAALLRLAFHDCQVQGCDASILLDSNGPITSELVAGKNFGIRKLEVIESIKWAVESQCPGVVSCADIVALAAREAIAASGGPYIEIPTGRRDATWASNLAADDALPPAFTNVDDFIKVFKAMGIMLQESVALLGAHTLGVGHCVNVVNRLYPFQDRNLQIALAIKLRLICPSPYPGLLNNISTINNDFTNVLFDNQYFRDLIAGRGLFTIDSLLPIDPRTADIVSLFASNQKVFFTSFSSAFVKMMAYNVLTGSDGEIRQNCRFTNQQL